MIDLSARVWNIALWIWFYFFIQVVMIIGIMIYLFRERVRKTYYKVRFPEKLIKVVVHYKTGQYREYWRVIPDEKTFSVGGKRYEFSDKSLIKENEFFTVNETDKTIIKAGNKKYLLEDELKIKKRRGKYPEIHYFYNVPSPIRFDYSGKDIKLSSAQLEEFQENDLFKKLLTLREEQRLLLFILIISMIGALASILVALKYFEVF